MDYFFSQSPLHTWTQLISFKEAFPHRSKKRSTNRQNYDVDNPILSP